MNPIDEEELETLLRDPNWCLQEKKDGRRLLIQKVGREIQGINRRGLVVSLPSRLEQQVGCIPHDFEMDGEIVGETFHAFDLSVASVLTTFVPLSEMMKEQLASLRSWAKGRARPATSQIPGAKTSED